MFSLSTPGKDFFYYYLFKNNSKELHLDAELEFKMTNLVIVGFEEASKVKVSLPPGSLQYVHLKRVDSTQNCNCEITQRFALNPPKVGKLPSVSIPVTYTIDTPREILMEQTAKEGTCIDHGTQDPNGLLIWQYQFEISGGYCFLWENASKDILFHKQLELELKNLAIVGKEEGTNKYVVDLKVNTTNKQHTHNARAMIDISLHGGIEDIVKLIHFFFPSFFPSSLSLSPAG